MLWDIGPEREPAGGFIAFYLLRQLQLSHFLWRMLKQACFRRAPKTHTQQRDFERQRFRVSFMVGARAHAHRNSLTALAREYFDAWSVLLPRGAVNRQDDFLPHRGPGWCVKYWPLYKAWHPSCRERQIWPRSFNLNRKSSNWGKSDSFYSHWIQNVMHTFFLGVGTALTCILCCAVYIKAFGEISTAQQLV